jgi:hypothetical protein
MSSEFKRHKKLRFLTSRIQSCLWVTASHNFQMVIFVIRSVSECKHVCSPVRWTQIVGVELNVH